MIPLTSDMTNEELFLNMVNIGYLPIGLGHGGVCLFFGTDVGD